MVKMFNQLDLPVDLTEDAPDLVYKDFEEETL